MAFGRIRNFYRRREMARELHALSDRQLRDIGMDRRDISAIIKNSIP